MVGSSKMQQQLAQLQEPRRVMFERSQEMKKTVLQRNASENWTRRSKMRAEALEVELEKAKESEGKMLESLTSQTKQLEQTKISLEEAKLEIRSLEESIKILEGSAGQNSRNLEKHRSLGALRAQNDIGILRTELKLALEAEEKSKRAMDDLAMVLKEVTTEANQVKEKHSRTQTELENSRLEAECMKTLLRSTEERLRSAFEDLKRMKLEAEESSAAWNQKENGFINFMKMTEEEVANVNQENSRLIDTLRSAREENSRLRDIMKQAVNEANVVKEALEIARNENSQLKDALAEKENALQSIKQEYECLKVSEAAALDSVKELSSLLTATSSLGSNKSSSIDIAGGKRSVKFSSEKWKGDNEWIQSGHTYSLEESARFEGSIFDMAWSPEQEKDQSLVSNNAASNSKAHFAAKDDREITGYQDFYNLNGTPFDDSENGEYSPSRQKKRRPSFRRIGDMFRRSFHNK